MRDHMLFVCLTHQAAIRRRVIRDRVLRDRARTRAHSRWRLWLGRRLVTLGHRLQAPAPPAPSAGSAQAAALR